VGNRRLVAEVAVDGHVKCYLGLEYPCLLPTSKAVSQQESCLILLRIGEEKTTGRAEVSEGRRTWARPRQWHRAQGTAVGTSCGTWIH
jgi:hypothetical protein